MVVGFAHAPVTKAVIVVSVFLSLAVSLLDAKAYFAFHVSPHLLVYHQYWQLFAYHILYVNSSELLLGSLLHYHASRGIERVFGSRKFVTLLVLLCLLHSAFSLVYGLTVVALARRAPAFVARLPGEDLWRTGYLPGGPFGLLAGIASQYYEHVPPLWTIRVGALDLTDRIAILLPVFLLAISQPPTTCISALLGAAASAVYSARFGSLGSLSQAAVPQRLYTAAGRVLAPLVGSTRLPMRSSRAEYSSRTVR
ncbi:hypothetical protein MSPP1_000025 [Malassezia sp. CBS 17886]|nr:hypothetical protein MSPP1_000025 [Malassezia sp. CBS 17886]